MGSDILTTISVAMYLFGIYTLMKLVMSTLIEYFAPRKVSPILTIV
jgi:hypothetical protein